MKSNIWCVAVVLCMSLLLHAPKSSVAQHVYWVGFTDKNNTTFSLQQPSQFLTLRAVDRKAAMQINIDSLDLPVPEGYIQQVLDSTGASLKLQLRWNNGIVISLTDSTAIQRLALWPNIASVQWISSFTTGWPYIKDTISTPYKPDVAEAQKLNYDANYYGSAWDQIQLCEGQYLHEQGYLGAQQLIGVIDGGFDGIGTNSFFQKLRQENRLVDAYNFLNNSTQLQNTGNHGTMVLSIMAADSPNTYVGVAPKAQYAVYHVDDGPTESYYEVFAYMAALERCDSMGVQLINASLGYNYFDESVHDLRRDNLTGNNSLLTRAVNTAVTKGMTVVLSAGNEGNRPWQQVLFPADAAQAITVGNVQHNKLRNPSSSMGTTTLTKPDVMALGSSIRVINTDESIVPTSGTSFAAPIVTGLLACYMEAFPNEQPALLKDKLKQSAHLGYNHDSLMYYGTGVPNFRTMYDGSLSTEQHGQEAEVLVYPNPFDQEINITLGARKDYNITLTNALLQTIYNNPKAQGSLQIATEKWPMGIYFLHIGQGTTYKIYKMIKL